MVRTLLETMNVLTLTSVNARTCTPVSISGNSPDSDSKLPPENVMFGGGSWSTLSLSRKSRHLPGFYGGIWITPFWVTYDVTFYATIIVDSSWSFGSG